MKRASFTFPFEEAWLQTFSDMECFTNSDDALSRLVSETAGGSYERELSESTLGLVAAARQVPRFHKTPDGT